MVFFECPTIYLLFINFYILEYLESRTFLILAHALPSFGSPKLALSLLCLEGVNFTGEF